MQALWLDPDPPIPPPGQDELPYDDGEPMETPKHRRQMNLLIELLDRRYLGRADVFIGGNMALYYSEIQARNNDFRAPDFFVVLNAREDRVRKSWVVWEENGRTPDVVIELLSPSTEREDRGRKMQIYAGLKVYEYYLFDPIGGALEGYRLREGAWSPIPARPDGDLDCITLGLRLTVGAAEHEPLLGPWLRWRLDDGSLIPSDKEALAAAQAEAQAAQAEAQAAQAEAQAAQAEAQAVAERARRLEERLRALGLDPEG